MSHAQDSIQLKILSPALLSCSKTPQTTPLSDPRAAEGVPKALLHLLPTCKPEQMLSRYPLTQVLASTENTRTFKSLSPKKINSRKTPRQQGKEDHSTEAWPHFREVQQHIQITAMERGNPGAWSLGSGFAQHRVCKQKKCVRTALN